MVVAGWKGAYLSAASGGRRDVNNFSRVDAPCVACQADGEDGMKVTAVMLAHCQCFAHPVSVKTLVHAHNLEV